MEQSNIQNQINLEMNKKYTSEFILTINKIVNQLETKPLMFPASSSMTNPLFISSLLHFYETVAFYEELPEDKLAMLSADELYFLNNWLSGTYKMFAALAL